MRVAIAADHAGLPLRQDVADTVTEAGHEPILLGPDSGEPVDYPDMAALVGEVMARGEAERGVVLCGSAAGANVAANQLDLVRAATAHDSYTGHQMVEHDDVNVLTMGARVIGSATATDVTRAFLGARFSGEERHTRRLRKTMELGWAGRANGGAVLHRDGVRVWVEAPTPGRLLDGSLAAWIENYAVTGFLDVPTELVTPCAVLLRGVFHATAGADGLVVLASGTSRPADVPENVVEHPPPGVLRATVDDHADAATEALRRAERGDPVVLAVDEAALGAVVAAHHPGPADL